MPRHAQYKFWYISLSFCVQLQRDHDDNAKQNLSLKMTSQSLHLLHDRFNSFNQNVAELDPGAEFAKMALQFRGNNENLPSCHHVLHKTFNLVISLKLPNRVKQIQRGRQARTSHNKSFN